MAKSTLYERLKNPEFSAKYQATCRDLLKVHTAALQAHMGEAIATMVEVMADKRNSPQTRVNAADNIFRHGVKLTEIADILERLKELEGEDS